MDVSTPELRRILLAPDEAIAQSVSGKTKAAVLVPICRTDEGLAAIFTRRRHDLQKHAGEISFPGGRPDPGDADLCSTALRETEEEIGLPKELVEVVGALPPTPTFVTGYAVYPFVGLFEAGISFKPNPAEVAAVLKLSLAELSSVRQKKRLVRKGLPVKTDTYEVGANLIWGATARMLSSFLDRLQG